MKVKLLVIAAIAVICAQSAQAARFRIVNKSQENYAFKINSEGLDYSNSMVGVGPGKTSETIGTGTKGVMSISWGAPYGFTAWVDMPAIVAGGRFTVLDTEGNYEYDYGLGRKGKGKAKRD